MKTLCTKVKEFLESRKKTPVKVALIVGHTAKHRGATLYDGRDEYTYNSLVAQKVASKMGELRVSIPLEVETKVFYRGSGGVMGVAEAVGLNGWGADVSIELHFNAAGTPKARGLEVICIDEASALKARPLIDALAYSFIQKPRGDRGIKWVSSYERGYKNIKCCQDQGVKYSMLLEPFFGDCRTSESVRYVEGVELYVDELIDFIAGL